MILDTLRIVSDWFADPTYGVAAMLAQVPLDGSDTRPAGVEIYDETRHADVAIGLLPVPATAGHVVLAVNMARDGVTVDGNAMPPIADGQVPIVIRIGRASSTPVTAVRDALYVSRAAYWSLRRLMKNDADAYAARTQRNGGTVAILTLAHLAITPFHVQLEDVQLVATWLAVLNVRDNTPFGP